MANEWPTVRVEDIAEKIAMGPFGSNIKVETFVETGVPVISGAHLRGVRLDDGDFNFVTDEHAERMKNSNVFRGDVIFTHAGNIGQVAYIPPNSQYARYVISQRQFYLRCDLSKADPAFVSYFFHSNDGQHKLLANASQTGVPSIARPSSYLKTIELSLPPLTEQRAIAHILGTLDDKIELNRRRNQTLEAMARALFKDWFVDFGPVRAKMEGREPYLPVDAWQLFPDSLDDEGRPKGWVERPLGDFVNIYDSRRVPLSGKQRAERQGPYPYHGAAGVMDGVDDFLFDGVHVLLGEDGSVVKPDGRPYTQYVWGKFWVNNHAHVLRGRGISNETLLVFLDQCDVAPFVTGAVQPKLSQGNLKAIPFIDAGDVLLRQFGEIVDPLFAQVRDSTEESHTLAQLRDTLLPKLISGELRIKDAEKFLERMA